MLVTFIVGLCLVRRVKAQVANVAGDNLFLLEWLRDAKSVVDHGLLDRVHRIKVREEAKGGGSIESEGQEVFEVELRLQRPSWDREGSQKGAALG